MFERIKDKKVLARRLIDGEVFISQHGLILKYDESKKIPFRCVHLSGHNKSMTAPAWSLFDKLKLKEGIWYEELANEKGQGIVCDVSWEEGSVKRDGKRMIVSAWLATGTYKFLGEDGKYYLEATPVNKL